MGLWTSRNVQAVIRHALKEHAFKIKPYNGQVLPVTAPVRMLMRSADGELFLITIERVIT